MDKEEAQVAHSHHPEENYRAFCGVMLRKDLVVDLLRSNAKLNTALLRNKYLSDQFNKQHFLGHSFSYT